MSVGATAEGHRHAVMCRKHTLKTFNGNAASRLAFETTFETLTAAGQSSAQVDLFKFGQEQCVLWTRPASFELAGKLLSGLHCLTPDHITMYGKSAVADGPTWRLLRRHDPFKQQSEAFGRSLHESCETSHRYR